MSVVTPTQTPQSAADNVSIIGLPLQPRIPCVVPGATAGSWLWLRNLKYEANVVAPLAVATLFATSLLGGGVDTSYLSSRHASEANRLSRTERDHDIWSHNEMVLQGTSTEYRDGISKEAFVERLKVAFVLAAGIADDYDACHDELAIILQEVIVTMPPKMVHDIQLFAKSWGVPSLAYHEILAALGDIEDSVSHHARLDFLASQLEQRDPIIRSGAATGLVALGDPRAAARLRRAAEVEQGRLLRLQLLAGAERLEATDANVFSA